MGIKVCVEVLPDSPLFLPVVEKGFCELMKAGVYSLHLHFRCGPAPHKLSQQGVGDEQKFTLLTRQFSDELIEQPEFGLEIALTSTHLLYGSIV